MSWSHATPRGAKQLITRSPSQTTPPWGVKMGSASLQSVPQLATPS